MIKRKNQPAVESQAELIQILVLEQLKLQLFMRNHAHEAGHTSYDRVYDLMQSKFWWIGMSSDVMEWLKACPIVSIISQDMVKGDILSLRTWSVNQWRE